MSIAPTTGWPRRTRTWGRARDWLATYGALTATIVAAFVLFLVAPWPFATKVHAALHGLCSQQPSHSLRLGGQMLPFEARMTGIYGGFLISAVYLLARGRTRAFRLPSRRMILLLIGFIALLGIDGVNSTLADLHYWHPYPPANLFRLATGLLTGLTLAAMLCFVVGTTLWQRGNLRQAVIDGPRDLLIMIGLDIPFALLVLSGWGWLYVPVALLLLVSAIVVVSAMCLVIVALLKYGDRVFETFSQLPVPIIAAFLLGIAVMALLAGGRFWLEHITHAPPMM